MSIPYVRERHLLSFELVQMREASPVVEVTALKIIIKLNNIIVNKTSYGASCRRQVTSPETEPAKIQEASPIVEVMVNKNDHQRISSFNW